MTTQRPMIVRSAGPGDVLRVNRTFTGRSDLTEQDLDTQPLLDWIHPEDREALERAVSAGEGSATARHRTQQGEWVSLDWQVKEHEDDKVALGLLSQDDVVGARSAGAALASKRSKTLGQTLDAMARIVEAKNPGLRCSILLTDAEHKSVSVGAGPSLPEEYNAAVEGLKIGPAVGSCGTAAFWNIPVVVENIGEDTLWKELRDAAALAGVLACWSHPITTTEGGVLGAMALYNDEPRAPSPSQMDGLEVAARMVGLAIERDALEEQLREAAKMKALGVLAGGIAHDFNNMLMAVLGNAELALMTLPEGNKARHMLEAIVKASVSATELCTQMLAYTGRGALSTEPVECNGLVRDLGGLLQVALSKKATLVLKLRKRPMCVLADRSQLRQVILNLITNAAEAIGDNVGQIVLGSSVRTFTREELDRWQAQSLEPGQFVVLRIADTGAGMNPETQAKVFEPYFTTKPSGRGLGLAAVQGIVRGHGGAIALESTPGGGTTFFVLLPRVALPTEEPVEEPEVECGADGARVLVVDDEPGVREILGEILEFGGHTVMRAADGEEAIDIFRREGDSIDCVLLDYSMPKLDGEEVFRELQAIRADVRVILSSGFTEDDFTDRLHDSGFAGFIQKPAAMDAVLAKVAEVLK